jgi:Holliday junction resolvase RusA-like endonuclease
VIGLNLGGTYAGGTPYIPIDAERSRLEGRCVYDMERVFEPKLPDYFRADIQLVYKKNKPGHSIEWRLDIRNFTNHRNAAFYYYDTAQKAVQLKNQRGLLPILSYRVDF